MLKDVGGVIIAHEGPPPLNVLQVPVVRMAGTFETVNVYWKATPDSAGLEDFQPSHGMLQFADGQVRSLGPGLTPSVCERLPSKHTLVTTKCILVCFFMK